MAIGPQTSIPGRPPGEGHHDEPDASSEQGQGMAEQAQQKAQEVAGQAQHQATQLAGQARERMKGQVDERSTQAGQQLASQADDIRSVAEQLRQQGKDKPAQLAAQAADRAGSIGSYLQESDADRILRDAEDFARRRPWAVVAGGIALGMAAARFLKASSTERYEQSLAEQRPALPARAMSDGGDGVAGGHAVSPATPQPGYGTGTGAV